jgi:5-methylcytosine-specific restriction endonuclease McrA
MNNIVLDDKRKLVAVKKHKDAIKKILLHGNMKNPNNIDKKYLEICNLIDQELKKIGIECTFEEIIVADFKQLKKYVNDLETKGVKFGKYSKKHIDGKPFQVVYEAYDKLISKNYNNDLISNLGISVCPYCNRDYVNNRGDYSSVQLDHFFPRSKFPIFAVSLFNLIPSCYACNHIKSDKMLSLSPYDEFDVDELLRFTYSINGLDFINRSEALSIHLQLYNSKGKSLKLNCDILQLEQAYSLHKNEVQALLRKLIVFSEYKIDEMWFLYKDLYNSREEIMKDIFGKYSSKDYLNNVLSKLESDIYDETRRNLR